MIASWIADRAIYSDQSTDRVDVRPLRVLKRRPSQRRGLMKQGHVYLPDMINRVDGA